MAIKIYQYSKCDTCRKAIKFLDSQGIDYEQIPIVESPPSQAELKQMLGYIKGQGGSLKNLFNTSGVQYREMGIASLLKEGLDEDEAIKLLSKSGKLIKRPFLLAQKDGRVGFNASDWTELLVE
ncbi:MAG: Spx/MgsR family RNA polymerase-binding regulatory protein [Proteobacteria bacterium]|nr:MAG: Spx/MgsR family RNA polymerase-binding regulatory protein [Pseudomonadota bacterium]